MLSNEDIQRYGGKATILNYVKEKLPHLEIPQYIVKQKKDNLSSILTDFNSMKKPVIVRSSSPFEYGDFEGIFESIKDVETKIDLERAILKVEQSAISERAKIYAKQNDFKINGEIHSIIQEQQTPSYLGGIMRHPNNPNLIYINFRTDKGEYRNTYGNFIFDDSSKEFIQEGGRLVQTEKREIRNLVEIYKEIESLKEIAEGQSLFVEYGLNPFSIFQVRPFKKIETADFKLPFSKLDKKKDNEFYLQRLCFGITPPEGIVLPVLKSVGLNEVITILPMSFPICEDFFKMGSPEAILPFELANIYFAHKFGAMSDKELKENSGKIIENYNLESDKNLKEPYCFITSSIKNDTFDTDLSVPNLKALILGRSENFLTHNSLRLIKKAEVSILGESLITHPFFKNISSLENKVRIISNGREAVAIRE
jgi:hypothetical protein